MNKIDQPNNDTRQPIEPLSPDQNINTTASAPKNNKTILWVLVAVIIVIILIVAIVSFILLSQTKKDDNPNNSSNTTSNQDSTGFGQQKKSAHFETSTPAHGSTLAGAPNQVVIDFDFDLAKPSSISITSNGKEFASGETVIDKDLTTMRRNMDVNAPNGIYEVKYQGCWPDKSCHDGRFAFKIDRSTASSYTDLRGKNEVTIEMNDIKFNPQNIIINKGTKVVWVNKESVTHYVNTDSHPAHTQVLDFNSKALDSGDNYSFTFNKAGAYPYHCSAHAAQMTGNILVED